MIEVWDQARVEQHITQGIEESLTLDYKAAGSLAKSDGKKMEVTKDVSAMANSAGGIIIYGVAEYQDKAHEHLPEKLDPVDRTQFPKEWLEQVISNIRPKIDGIVIHPVSISTAVNHVVYVVEIPQSSTAHQATDKRYYKRFNFESVAMEDYEIRDIMNRNKHPVIVPKFGIFVEDTRDHGPKSTLALFAINEGTVLANYVNVELEIPTQMVYRDKVGDEVLEELFGIEPPPNTQFRTFKKENTQRDVIGVKPGMSDVTYQYGPSRYVPILPKRYFQWEIELSSDFLMLERTYYSVKWEIFADNAPPLSGKIAVEDIKVVDKRRI